MNLTAVILAGGFGTRLRSAVPDCQKVVAVVNGRPFLSFLLDHVMQSGIRQVVLCTGYKSSQVKEIYGDRYQNLELSYSEETDPLGTAGALAQALTKIYTPDVLVMNGDSYCSFDLAAFWQNHTRCHARASILLIKVADVQRYGQIDITTGNQVTSFIEKGARNGPGWINAGIYLIQKSMLEEIPVGQKVSIERDSFPTWIGCGLFAFQSHGRFLDIGTPEDYKTAETFFASKDQATGSHTLPASATGMFVLKAANAQTRIKAGVGIIIRDAQNRILLEKRSDCGMWGLPGGRIEPGETIIQTAHREVKEETGLEIEITRLTGVYSEPSERIVVYPDNGDVRQLIDIILEAKVLSGTLSCSGESTALQFFEPDHLPFDLVPPSVTPLRDALSGKFGVVN